MSKENNELDQVFSAYTKAVINMCNGDSIDVADEAKTAKSKIQAYTNAEIAKVLERLESAAVYAEYDKAEDDVICGDVVPLEAIQAERVKLKEEK